VYRKGAQKERELIELLKSKGFGAVRVAGSRAPDIVAGKNGRFYVIECKYSSKDTMYVSLEELEREIEVARIMGAEFLLAVKFANKKWRFLDKNAVKSMKTGKSVKIELKRISSLPSVELILDKNLKAYEG